MKCRARTGAPTTLRASRSTRTIRFRCAVWWGPTSTPPSPTSLRFSPIVRSSHSVKDVTDFGESIETATLYSALVKRQLAQKGMSDGGSRDRAQAHRLRFRPHREGQGKRQRHFGLPGLVQHGDAALCERAGIMGFAVMRSIIEEKKFAHSRGAPVRRRQRKQLWPEKLSRGVGAVGRHQQLSGCWLRWLSPCRGSQDRAPCLPMFTYP